MASSTGGEVSPRSVDVSAGEVSREAVERQLDAIVSSNAFRDSPTLKRLLRYIVQNSLAGRGEDLKEYRLGLEVFDRDPSFDPRLDPSVRMAARRLRVKLEEYYQKDGPPDRIRITVPKGHYVAVFTTRNGQREVEAPPSRRRIGVRFRLAIVVFVALAVLAFAGYTTFSRLSRRVRVAGETKQIVISELINKTGDPVFDDTLKQAISVEFGQSPFLSVVSEERVQATLKLMSRPVDTKITPGIAREVCQRAGGTTYIRGEILLLGRQYVIGLSAVNCQGGDFLGQEQAIAGDKEHVLKALEEASLKLRERLGESTSTLTSFDVPLEQATTPSLDALKAYSLGNVARDRKGDAAALPFFGRALELDSQFALAYDARGISYSNLDEPGLASDDISEAYRLRDRASERERFQIAADYSQLVTGELEKANQTCELWAQTYPRDEYPHDLQGVNYEFVGQYEKAIAEMSKALQLNPDGSVLHSNLMEEYVALNRLEAAKNTYQAALARNLDHPYLHAEAYAVAFLEGDAAAMEKQLAWAAGRPGAEDFMFSVESDSNAFFGRLTQAREYSQRAVESAKRGHQSETAALWQANAALREAEFGNFGQARRQITDALKLGRTRDVKILAALTLARAGDLGNAEEMARDLAQHFPLNTVINDYWLPTIGAAVEVRRGHPGKAIDLLERTRPYELGYPNPQIEVGRLLYPIYLRGESYLLLRRGDAAANEFGKMLASRGLLVNSPLRALAYVGLARAYAISGDKAKSRAAYEQFFSQWKDADSVVPVLKQAKAAYVSLN